MKENVLVIGCGISGRAVIDYCQRVGHDVVAVDKCLDLSLNVPLYQENHHFSHFSFDRVIISPSTRLTHPQILRASNLGVPVMGEVEWALSMLPGKKIGVTGTNGKSTTVSLITHTLRQGGWEAKAVGNIGDPAISHVGNGSSDEKTIFVTELSSFQLMTMEQQSLDGAILLNVEPDHLDWHENFDAYRRAKEKIFSLVKGGGWSKRDCTNIEALQYVCHQLGVPEQQVERSLSSFQPLPHRGEYVATVNGVMCINNSKATNISSLVYALNQVKGPVVLICGGDNKGVSFASIAKKVEKCCRSVILIGKSKNVIANELSPVTQRFFVETMDEAIQKGLQHAQRGDTLLLAPGCSSRDMFADYCARGEAFKEGVLKKGHHR